MPKSALLIAIDKFSTGSIEHVQQLLERFASIYVRHWRHRPKHHDLVFLEIVADIPLPPEAPSLPGMQAQGLLRGRLVYGANDGPSETRHAGFSACLTISFEVPDQGLRVGSQQEVWRKHYPCAHVPFAVSPDSETDAPRLVPRALQIPLGDGTVQLPPGFQLPPGVALVNGLPTWVGDVAATGNADASEWQNVDIEDAGWTAAPPPAR
jgi:hypothetical protein